MKKLDLSYCRSLSRGSSTSNPKFANSTTRGAKSFDFDDRISNSNDEFEVEGSEREIRDSQVQLV